MTFSTKILSYIVAACAVALLPAELILAGRPGDRNEEVQERSTATGAALFIFKEHAVPQDREQGDLSYSITVRNDGDNSPGTDSVVIIDQIPDNYIFSSGGATVPEGEGYTKDVSSVSFEGDGSGLTFEFERDVAFSNSQSMPFNFEDCNYKLDQGAHSAVRYICVNPKGTLAFGQEKPEFKIHISVKKVK